MSGSGSGVGRECSEPGQGAVLCQPGSLCPTFLPAGHEGTLAAALQEGFCALLAHVGTCWAVGRTDRKLAAPRGWSLELPWV